MDAFRALPTLTLGTVMVIALAACSPSPTATPPPPTATAVPSPVPSPTPTPRTLNVCMGQEPDTLYIYGGAMLAADHVQQAVCDGPIDNTSFGYQAIIIERIPYLDTGDTVINVVTMDIGDIVLTADDYPIQLTEDIIVPVPLRPAGCYDHGCVVD